MSEFPKDAREQIKARWAACAHEDTWIYELALSALDAQEAAGEGVTEEMVLIGVRALLKSSDCCWNDAGDAELLEAWGDETRAALLAVHPAIFAAGERAGLEKAADEAEQTIGYDAYGNCITRTGEEIATAIRSLKGGTP